MSKYCIVVVDVVVVLRHDYETILRRLLSDSKLESRDIIDGSGSSSAKT